MRYQLFIIPMTEPPLSNEWPRGSLAWSNDKQQIALAQLRHVLQAPGILGFDLQTHQLSRWAFPPGGKLIPALGGAGWWVASEQGVFQLRWQEPVRPLLSTESWPGWQLSHFLKHTPAPPFLLALQSGQQQGRLMALDGQPRLRQRWLVSPWGGKDVAPAKDGWWITRKNSPSSDTYLTHLSSQGGIQNFEEVFFKHSPLSMTSSSSLEQLFCLNAIEVIVLDVRQAPKIVYLQVNAHGLQIFWKDPDELWVVNRKSVDIFKLDVSNKWQLILLQSIPIPHEVLQADWHPEHGLVLQTTHWIGWIPIH